MGCEAGGRRGDVGAGARPEAVPRRDGAEDAELATIERVADGDLRGPALQEVHLGAERPLRADDLLGHRAQAILRHPQHALGDEALAGAAEEVACVERVREDAVDDARLHLGRKALEDDLVVVQVVVVRVAGDRRDVFQTIFQMSLT